MNKYKMLDLFHAFNNEATDVVLSEILPEVVEEYGEFIVGESLAVLAGEVVGAVCPRINNIRIGYKQNRLERNVNRMFAQLIKKQDELDERLKMLEAHNHKYLTFVTEMLLDNIIDEIQECKVDYNVNGYINLIISDVDNEDVALMFFRSLSQLSDLDISVLKTYANNSTGLRNISVTGEQIPLEQMKFIKEKLVRFGFLQSKNEEISDKNLELVVKYIQDIDKERKKSKPKEVRIPNLKKISSSDSYKITTLGKQYLALMLNN